MLRNIIEIKNLTKTFGEVVAVDKLSLSVRRGELFAFLGLNGAGKSTTINIICSLLKKDGGEVRVAGFDIDENPDGVKRSLGVVFQNSVLDAKLTVKENLMTRAKLYMSAKEARERIDKLADMLALGEIMNRRYGKLSGGQRRRSDVARALLGSPELLILDEPTTGLDPQTRRNVWDALENLRKADGLTVFLTTHYMEEANRADNVVILDSGRIVAQGTPAELKSRFSGDYLMIYGERNALRDKLFSRYGGAFEAGRYVIKVESSDQTKRILREFDGEITDFEVLKGDMDDVFLRATGKSLGGV